MVETRPADPGTSAYERVLSYVDRETCVALRIELFEPGGKLRKEFVANPAFVRREGSRWIAGMALMYDLRDSTTTQVLVDASEQDVALPKSMFQLAGSAPAPESD